MAFWVYIYSIMGTWVVRWLGGQTAKKAPFIFPELLSRKRGIIFQTSFPRAAAAIALSLHFRQPGRRGQK